MASHTGIIFYRSFLASTTLWKADLAFIIGRATCSNASSSGRASSTKLKRMSLSSFVGSATLASSAALALAASASAASFASLAALASAATLASASALAFSAVAFSSMSGAQCSTVFSSLIPMYCLYHPRHSSNFSFLRTISLDYQAAFFL